MPFVPSYVIRLVIQDELFQSPPAPVEADAVPVWTRALAELPQGLPAALQAQAKFLELVPWYQPQGCHPVSLVSWVEHMGRPFDPDDRANQAQLAREQAGSHLQRARGLAQALHATAQRHPEARSAFVPVRFLAREEDQWVPRFADLQVPAGQDEAVGNLLVELKIWLESNGYGQQMRWDGRWPKPEPTLADALQTLAQVLAQRGHHAWGEALAQMAPSLHV